MAHSLIGAPIRRREDPPLVTGQGRYVDDLPVTGVLHMAFVRSPYPKARIVAIHTEAATVESGVVAVFTADDVKSLGTMPAARATPDMVTPPHPLLAADFVYAVGIPVAAVVAESKAQAEDAAALVEVEYEPEDSIGDAEAALAPSAPLARNDVKSNECFRVERRGGDVDQAFRDADRVVSLHLYSPRLAPVPMEPRGAVAAPEPFGDGLTLWLSTQSPFRARAEICKVLRFPENRLRLIAPDVGGGFGGKGGAYREEVLVAHAALTLQRPVKWISTRSEDLATTQQGRDMRVSGELALTRDGTMLGLKVRTVANLGGYLQSNAAGPPSRLLVMPLGAYRIPNVLAEVIGVFTNTTPTGPYRGAGRPEAALLIERLVDHAARELGMDPLEIRRKNFIQPAEFPYRTATGAVYDSGDYELALTEALKRADYEHLLAERERRREGGEIVGIGLATFVEPSGGAGYESGTVRIERTGEVTALTGSSSHGQGHETVFAQVVAERLGVPMERVLVRHGDTFASAQGVGSFGSRSGPIGGSALAVSAERVVAKARRIAAHIMEVSSEDVALVDDGFIIAGAPRRRVTWNEIADAAYGSLKLPPGDEPGLEATVFYQPEREMYGFGTHLAVISVDRETGRTRLEKLVAIDDCGVVLNPLVVEGQIQGSIAQGLGQAFLEQIVFDENGQLITGTLMDYAIPHARDIPLLDLGHTVTPSPRNVLGVKGVGECGTVGAPAAIANAVADALAPFGVTEVDMPFSAERMWRLVNPYVPLARIRNSAHSESLDGKRPAGTPIARGADS